MSAEMTTTKAKELRKEFPASAIGKLPKPYKADSQKGNCRECGGYHGLPAVHLDYVGHAATTARLLEVDPEWTWRPFTQEELVCLPPKLRDAGLWIHLTVCGVTRPGVGDGKSAKECIGDAIRNAAMRFGVALDLWAKEDLHEISAAQNPTDAPAERPAPPAPAERVEFPPAPATAPESPLLKTSGNLAKRMFALMGEAGITDRDLRLAFVSETVGRTVAGSAEMTDDDARRVTTRLEGMLDSPFPAADEPQDGGE